MLGAYIHKVMVISSITSRKTTNPSLGFRVSGIEIFSDVDISKTSFVVSVCQSNPDNSPTFTLNSLKMHMQPPYQVVD